MENNAAGYESKRRYSGDGPEVQHCRMQRRKSLPGSFACSWDSPSIHTDPSPTTSFSGDQITAHTRELELQSQNRGLMNSSGYLSGQNDIAIQSHTNGQPFWNSPYNASLQSQAYKQQNAPTPFDYPQTMPGTTQRLPGMNFPSGFRMDESFAVGSAAGESCMRGNSMPTITSTNTASMMETGVRRAMLDRQCFDFLGMGTTCGSEQLGFQQRIRTGPCYRRASLGNEPAHSMGRDFHQLGMELRTHQQAVMGAQPVLEQKMRFEAPRAPVESLSKSSYNMKIEDHIFMDEDDLSISHAFSSDDDVSAISAIELPLSSQPNFVLTLALPGDKVRLSGYQTLLRQSLEYFSATKEDVETRVRGRKQKIRLGQIGVRCRYCAHLRIESRGKGAVYFPQTLINVYQAAQNISAAHFSCERYICPYVPITSVEGLDDEKPRKSLSKGGRAYWIDACQSAGIVEKDRALWLEGCSSTIQEETMNHTKAQVHEQDGAAVANNLP